MMTPCGSGGGNETITAGARLAAWTVWAGEGDGGGEARPPLRAAGAIEKKASDQRAWSIGVTEGVGCE